ncbi:hypothetical protein GF342_00595 [Candidatus Woesearchaeota archaeon]|nr:hypothetical protein [Candidatus Woesearchaeota archaeon]
MVKYLQASDIHNFDALEAIVETANDLDLDAMFLLGDFVEGREYHEITQGEVAKFQERAKQLDSVALEGLSERQRQAVFLHMDTQRYGGIEQIEQNAATESDPKMRKAWRQLLGEYHSFGDDMDAALNRLQELQDDDEFQAEQDKLQEEAQELDERVADMIAAKQDGQRREFEAILAQCKYSNAVMGEDGRLYVGDGNHDGQLLRGIQNAKQIQELGGVTINGVVFAFEPNTRETVGTPNAFYEGLDSMLNDIATSQMQRAVENHLEQAGPDANAGEFRRKVLNDLPVYNRLANIDDIDVLLLHNPVGRHAYAMVDDGSGKKKRSFIDYSYAVDQIIREKQPSVIGWGHIHGEKGDFDENDPTFGYQYQGVHTTDRTFCVIDLDEETKKINLIDVYRILETDAADPQYN